MRSLRLAILFGALAACSGSTTSTARDGSVVDSGVAPGDVPAAGDSGFAGSLPGDDYCNTPAGTCMGSEVSTCGVCIAPPTRRQAVRRTNCDDTQRREYCRTGDVGPANLSCFERANWPVAGASERVTMWGYVRVFGNGNDSQHIRVTVYRPNADGTPGEMIGTAVSDLAHPANGTEDVLSPTRDRVLFTRNLGGYHIENVPTETELLVVTEADAADSTARMLWSHKIYDFNVMLRNAEVNAEALPMNVPGARHVRFNARVISNGDWQSIPATSALTEGIGAGRGALAGEVHDCDDVRLANATVESRPRRVWDGPTVYFSDNDTNPLPDLSRGGIGTSLLGTYALLDLNAGPVTVVATGYDANMRLVHLGSYRARVFPDSVTIVTFRGLRPWQVPMR
ncbi:MAG: hypothetical protein R3A48_20600 [Polyangiales bacterium]